MNDPTSGQSVPKSDKFSQDSKIQKPSERLQGDKPPNPNKRLDRSKLRTERTGAKLAAARDKKAAQKPPKRPGVIKGVTRAAKFEAWRQIHGKVHQAEHENVGVEAAHRTELAGESAVRGASRFVKRRIRTRPARQVRKWEKRDIKAKADFAYKKLTVEHPEIKKNAISRYLQKKRLKRRYQKQAREAAKRGARAAQKTAVTTEKIAASVGRFVVKNPKVLLLIGCVVLLLLVLQACMGMFASLGGGIGGGVGGVAENADGVYSRLETELQLSIGNIETDYTGYDEYRYTLGAIGHNPAELLGFLAVCDPFPEAEMENVLREVFNAQYVLTVTDPAKTQTTESGAASETATSAESSTTSEPPRVLEITLTVTPFSEAVAVRLTPEQLERFKQYDYTQ